MIQLLNPIWLLTEETVEVLLIVAALLLRNEENITKLKDQNKTTLD